MAPVVEEVRLDLLSVVETEDGVVLDLLTEEEGVVTVVTTVVDAVVPREVVGEVVE